MFDGAKQKIERANYHILELEGQFAAFVHKKPHRFSVETNPQTNHLSVRVRFVEELPSSFALIIGDAIHNLRTALDHMTWELVGRVKGTQDRKLSFPTGDNRVNFESSCNGIKTPCQWVKDAIKATEAFVGGKGTDIYQLNRLDIADKHQVITPVLRATIHPRVRIVRSDGHTVRVLEGKVVVSGTDDFADVATVPPGFSVELDDDDECPPNIFFVEPTGTLGLPMIPTLRRFSKVVANTVASIERAVPL